MHSIHYLPCLVMICAAAHEEVLNQACSPLNNHCDNTYTKKHCVGSVGFDSDLESFITGLQQQEGGVQLQEGVFFVIRPTKSFTGDTQTLLQTSSPLPYATESVMSFSPAAGTYKQQWFESSSEKEDSLYGDIKYRRSAEPTIKPIPEERDHTRTKPDADNTIKSAIDEEVYFKFDYDPFSASPDLAVLASLQEINFFPSARESLLPDSTALPRSTESSPQSSYQLRQCSNTASSTAAEGTITESPSPTPASEQHSDAGATALTSSPVKTGTGKESEKSRKPFPSLTLKANYRLGQVVRIKGEIKTSLAILKEMLDISANKMKVIQDGGEGQVFQLEVAGSVWAFKQFWRDSISIDDVQFRFESGSGDVAALQFPEHDHIVKVHALWLKCKVSNHYCLINNVHQVAALSDFLIMGVIYGYVNGADIHTHFESGTLQPGLKLALEVSLQIGEAILALHKKGFIYRDLKIENVMYDDTSRRFYLVDYGLCKQIYTNPTSTYCGTPGIIPPEMLRGSDYKISADYWSFGAFLVAVATNYDISGFFHSYVKRIHIARSAAHRNIIIFSAKSDEEKIEYMMSHLLAPLGGNMKFMRVIAELTRNNPNKRLSIEDALEVLRQIKSETYPDQDEDEVLTPDSKEQKGLATKDIKEN